MDTDADPYFLHPIRSSLKVFNEPQGRSQLEGRYCLLVLKEPNTATNKYFCSYV
jgi:hypothetical protein